MALVSLNVCPVCFRLSSPHRSFNGDILLTKHVSCRHCKAYTYFYNYGWVTVKIGSFPVKEFSALSAPREIEELLISTIALIKTFRRSLPYWQQFCIFLRVKLVLFSTIFSIDFKQEFSGQNLPKRPLKNPRQFSQKRPLKNRRFFRPFFTLKNAGKNS